MYMTSPHLVGTKLTPHSYYLDVVFLLCFLPKFRGKDNRKFADGSLGKKRTLFLPPRAGHSGSASSPASQPSGKGVCGRSPLESVGHGTHRRAGTVSPHSSFPGRGRATAYTGSAAWPVPPYRATLGPAVSRGWARGVGSQAACGQRCTPGPASITRPAGGSLALHKPAPSIATIHRKVTAIA